MVLTLDGNPWARLQPLRRLPRQQVLASATGGVVPQLPKADGKVTGKGPHSIEGTLGSNTAFEATGVYDSLTGARACDCSRPRASIPPSTPRSPSPPAGCGSTSKRPTARASASSKPRPISPRLRGRMVFDFGQYGTLLESVEGTATQVRYRLSRPAR